MEFTVPPQLSHTVNGTKHSLWSFRSLKNPAAVISILVRYLVFHYSSRYILFCIRVLLIVCIDFVE